MNVCDYCNKPIRSLTYWRRTRNGKKEFVCNKCAAMMVDERTINDLLIVIDKENTKAKTEMDG